MMVEAIFEYIDFIVSVVRPRRLLFMAIDGVAPRAKMNQQRSRRFKSIAAAEDAAKMDKQLRALVCKEFERRGLEPPPRRSREPFDYNCITPGTEFMELVSDGLRWYVAQRQSSDPAWRDLQVVVSDSNIPGEGEHKLMEFIRNQRMQPDYDPSTSHCIYGLDADLLFLSLVTHEANFSVLREQVTQNARVCNRCGKAGHMVRDCPVAIPFVPRVDGTGKSSVVMQQFQFVDIPILKEYLEMELKPKDTSSLSFEWDIERASDDFVLMNFLVGNDFLPHIPCLDIREGAIDVLMYKYRELLPTMGGYIATNGNVNFSRLGMLVKAVANLEDDILCSRANAAESQWKPPPEKSLFDQSETELKSVTDEEVKKEMSRMKKDQLLNSEQEPNVVKPGTEGWRNRYWSRKFGREEGEKDTEFINQVCHSFLDGMVWVLQYYFQGCLDWSWFFPYHYPPTARDMANVDWDNFVPSLAARGTTKPFTPLEQLMAVLPPGSAWCLPKPFAHLMTAKESPLLEYYPLTFKQDYEGLHPLALYKAVAQLPFIDGPELLSTLSTVRDQLTPAELLRDQPGTDRLFVSRDTEGKVREQIEACWETPGSRLEVRAPGSHCNLWGWVSRCDDYTRYLNASYAPPFDSARCKTFKPNRSLCAFYELGPMPEGGYVARRLPGAPEKYRSLNSDDRPNQVTSRGTHALCVLKASIGEPTPGWFSRTRAFEPDAPHQGSNPYRRDNNGGRGGGDRGDDRGRQQQQNQYPESFDVYVTGIPADMSNGMLQGALMDSAARLGLPLTPGGFSVKRLPTGASFVRAVTREQQESYMRMVEGVSMPGVSFQAGRARSGGNRSQQSSYQQPSRHQPQQRSNNYPSQFQPQQYQQRPQAPQQFSLPPPPQVSQNTLEPWLPPPQQSYSQPFPSSLPLLPPYTAGGAGVKRADPPQAVNRLDPDAARRTRPRTDAGGAASAGADNLAKLKKLQVLQEKLDRIKRSKK